MSTPGHIRYGIKVGQLWTSADGAGIINEVLDVTTYEHCDDIIVQHILKDGTRAKPHRIDAWKLAKVRYMLHKDVE